MQYVDLKRDYTCKFRFLSLKVPKGDEVHIKTAEFWTAMRIDAPYAKHIETINGYKMIWSNSSPLPPLVSWRNNMWFYHPSNCILYQSYHVPDYAIHSLHFNRNNVIQVEKRNLMFGVIVLTDILSKDVCSVILLLGI